MESPNVNTAQPHHAGDVITIVGEFFKGGEFHVAQIHSHTINRSEQVFAGDLKTFDGIEQCGQGEMRRWPPL